MRPIITGGSAAIILTSGKLFVAKINISAWVFGNEFANFSYEIALHFRRLIARI